MDVGWENFVRAGTRAHAPKGLFSLRFCSRFDIGAKAVLKACCGPFRRSMRRGGLRRPATIANNTPS